MAVDAKHPEYIKWENEWKKCRDAFDGQKAVKAGGEKYLPRLSAQLIDDYNAYKNRALFYSITGKSVSALVGMVVSKRPILKYPKPMAPYFEESSGTQFYELLASCTAEVLLMSRYGILMDRQLDGGTPQPHGYKAENILNWKENYDGKPYLVVLTETTFLENQADEFEHTASIQYRVLRLTPPGQLPSQILPALTAPTDTDPMLKSSLEGYVYSVSIYDADKQLKKHTVPVNTGRPMSYIPFYVINPFGVGFATTKPMMLDIADINISHYCTSADLEHGRHFTGLPTAVVSGVDASTVLKVGSMTAWILPDANATAKYLEFTGQGLASLERAMAEKQSQLASMSARILDNSHKGSEAADTVRLRYMSETASLSSVARAVEAGLNLAYSAAADMEGYNVQDVLLKLDKEFLDSRMSAAELAKMTESYLTGGMSVETYVFNLRRGDLIPVTRTDEDEIASLEEAKAAMLAAQEAAQAAKNKPTGGPTP